MYDIFRTRKINYSLSSQTDFDSGCVDTNKLGLNSMGYFGSKISNMVPLEIIEVSKYSNKNQIGSIIIVIVSYVRPI